MKKLLIFLTAVLFCIGCTQQTYIAERTDGNHERIRINEVSSSEKGGDKIYFKSNENKEYFQCSANDKNVEGTATLLTPLFK